MKSEVINIKTPVSRVGNKTAILHILYALFPLHYGRFIDVFGGSGSVLLGKPTIDAFEVYNDFDRNLVNLFRCMKERTMATIRELGFCNLNSREDFIAIRKFFDHETFDDRLVSMRSRSSTSAANQSAAALTSSTLYSHNIKTQQQGRSPLLK